MSGANAWIDVAKKDFADAARSKMLWALSALMILFVGIASYAPKALGGDTSIEAALNFMSTPMLVLVPILAMIVGYMSIVGERDTGSIRMLLSLPIVRGEVVVGKFLGRLGVLSVPTLLGFGVGAVVMFALYGELPAGSFVEFLVLTLLVAVLYIALAVSISASVDSRGKAMGLAAGTIIVLEYLWSAVPLGVYYLLNGNLRISGGPPEWFMFLSTVTPKAALQKFLFMFFDFGFADQLSSLQAGSDAPIYLQNWFSGIIVLLWIAVPLAIGYLRFQRATIS
ncbi:ABC-2 type transport system permease protein [Natronoarchaeum philippinense]|uniref:ABC-2 type transport system permease protein n=1 Tax=Natronoarchaeum philippinense TaxID=558529 RepID=A0A285N5N2_NATPI|nr:ABC transporter permease [Natronoarchaeum philippinense]SNZ04752.1 ABC-2 type transport system permease protein [Natronoarchaeum philippinense]